MRQTNKEDSIPLVGKPLYVETSNE
jgi:hypothetical protein